MSKSDFRGITGHVLVTKIGSGGGGFQQLYMFGAMPFLFVHIEGRYTHLLPDNTFGTRPDHRWDKLWIDQAYRLEPHTTVVAAVDIARETAKRLGVEVS